jgi:hypothetical protein
MSTKNRSSGAAPASNAVIREHIITNQTAIRIAIEQPIVAGDACSSPACGWLILPPFGKQHISEDEESRFNINEWIRLGLIKIKLNEKKPVAPSAPLYKRFIQVLPRLWLIPLILIAVGVAALMIWLWQGLPLAIYGAVGALTIAVTLISGLLVASGLVRTDDQQASETPLGQLFKGLSRYALIILIGFGVPGVVLLLSLLKEAVEKNTGTLDPTSPMTYLSLLNDAPIEILLRLGFVTIAGTMPALLLFLFHSQRLKTLRESFIRDVIRLNPNILTRRDAKIMYGGLMDDILGKIPGVIPGARQIPILISTFLFALGWSLTLIVNQVGVTGGEIFSPHRSALIFGFLGAYFFSINMIFRRYVRADMNIKAYTHMAMRVLVTFVLIWVVSVLLQPDDGRRSPSAPAPTATPSAASPTPQAAGAGQPSATDSPQPGATATQPVTVDPQNEPPVTPPDRLTLVVLYLMAFFVGIVPETATAVIQDFLRSQSWVGRFMPSLQEQHPLSKLEGITLYDQARLLEEGVENIENLAHHNLIELMLRTRIPTPRLVDLVDQAILYLHVRGPVQGDMALSNADDSDDGLLNRLHTLGIRTATDLARVYKSAETRGNGRANVLSGLLPGQEARIGVILQALEDDEWMVNLHHWRKLTRTGEYPYTLRQFVATFMTPYAAAEGNLNGNGTTVPEPNPA